MNSHRYVPYLQYVRYLLLAVLASSVSPTAFAGQESHGGNVVLCQGRAAVTLDAYNAALPTLTGPADIVNLSRMTSDEVVDLIRSRFAGSPFLNEFDNTAKKFGPYTQWPLTDLKSVDDSAEPYFLPAGCQRATAAARQDDTIYLDQSVFAQLSDAQKGLLYVHEILYALSGLDTSVAVREMLRTLLLKNPTPDQILQAVHLIGPYYAFDFLEQMKAPFMDLDQTWNSPLANSPHPEISWSPGDQDVITHRIATDFELLDSFVYCQFDNAIDCSHLQACTLQMSPRVAAHPECQAVCDVQVIDLQHMNLACPGHPVQHFIERQ